MKGFLDDVLIGIVDWRLMMNELGGDGIVWNRKWWLGWLCVFVWDGINVLIKFLLSLI